MKKLLSVIAMACCLFAAQAATAYPIAGDGDWGDFEGDFSYLPSNDTTDKASIVMKLTNTSDPANGGYLTAFAFNLPGVDGVAINDVVLKTDDGSAFGLIGEASGPKHKRGSDFDNTIKAVPYGYYDIGASVNPDNPQPFLGGGSPTAGIQPGDTEHFEFLLYGENLNLLTLDDFFNELPYCKNGCCDDATFFIARFKGFDNDKSDKVPGSPVPVPAAAWLLGSGLIGLAGLKKKMR
jgi:hypothetical protein